MGERPTVRGIVVRPVGAVAFLFIDIEGSTRRWEHEPDAMRVELGEYDRIVRAAVAAGEGDVIKAHWGRIHAGV